MVGCGRRRPQRLATDGPQLFDEGVMPIHTYNIAEAPEKVHARRHPSGVMAVPELAEHDLAEVGVDAGEAQRGEPFAPSEKTMVERPS